MNDGDVVEVTLTGCEFKRVGEKNTPMCELMAKNEDDEYLKIAIFMTEKSAGIARQQFKKFGFEIDKYDLSRLPEFIKAKSPRVTVTIESREYRDNIYYQGVIEIGERPKNALPKDDLSEMTKWMRDAKKNREEESAAPAAPAKPAEKKKPINDDVNFDDIPF